MPGPPALALSPLDILLVIGLGAVGFVLVMAVCAVVMVLLAMVLPPPRDGEADPGSGDLDRKDDA